MSAQPPKPLPPEVIVALQRGNLIQAIKLLRAAGNIDLKQAKEAIEQHLDRSKVAKATVGEALGSLFAIPAVADALRKGNKIDAIRILREKTGLGLKEAKDAVDRFPTHTIDKTATHEAPKSTQQLSRPGLAPGEVPRSEGGTGRWWLVALIIIGAIAYYVYERLG
jgi:ribosomal protein L7/L12